MKVLNINKPEVAYFLGFFWADGHLRKSSKNSYYLGLKNNKTAKKSESSKLMGNNCYTVKK